MFLLNKKDSKIVDFNVYIFSKIYKFNFYIVLLYYLMYMKYVLYNLNMVLI